MKFYRLAMGARFTVGGKRFTKCGMGAAEDERRWCYTFFGIMDVEPEGEPLLLSPEEAAKRKPHYGPWQEFIEQQFGAEIASRTGELAAPLTSFPASGRSQRGASPSRD